MVRLQKRIWFPLDTRLLLKSYMALVFLPVTKVLISHASSKARHVLHSGLIRKTQLLLLATKETLLKAYADDHWSEENRNLYALWPRLSATKRTNNYQKSTWFMRDGSFLRLKSVEMGYTIPEKITKKAHISMLRFYLSGTNLLTFSKFKLWDVEMGGKGLGYPVQMVINAGVQLNF